MCSRSYDSPLNQNLLYVLPILKSTNFHLKSSHFVLIDSDVIPLGIEYEYEVSPRLPYSFLSLEFKIEMLKACRLKGNSTPKTSCIHMKHLTSISLILKYYSVVIFS